MSLSEAGAAITGLSSDPAAERANIKFSSKLLGGSIVAQGALAGSTLDGAVDVSVKQLNLAQTNSFIQTYMRGALAGTLGSSLKVNINKGTPSIAGQVTLNDFSIKQGREQPFTLKALQTNIESISFVQKKALIKEVKLIQPALQLTQYRNGLNFNLLFSPLLPPLALQRQMPLVQKKKRKKRPKISFGIGLSKMCWSVAVRFAILIRQRVPIL